MRRREFIILLGGAVSVEQRAGALLILFLPAVRLLDPRPVAELALHRNLPGITLFSDFTRTGGLLAYGPDLLDMYGRSGVMIGKVLRAQLRLNARSSGRSSSSWW